MTPNGSNPHPTLKSLEIVEVHGQNYKGKTPNDRNIALFAKVAGEKEGTTEIGNYQIELSFDPATARQIAGYLVELADSTDTFEYSE